MFVSGHTDEPHHAPSQGPQEYVLSLTFPALFSLILISLIGESHQLELTFPFPPLSLLLRRRVDRLLPGHPRHGPDRRAQGRRLHALLLGVRPLEREGFGGG